jgi:pimeloyl-ACP methyl ester carboxylesterase
MPAENTSLHARRGVCIILLLSVTIGIASAQQFKKVSTLGQMDVAGPVFPSFSHEVVGCDPVCDLDENEGNTDRPATPMEFKELLQRHSGEVFRSDYFVSGRAQNIRLFVRHVAYGSSQSLPILLVHGGSPGSEVIFDLPIPGYSLAEDLARMGLDVFLMDARGWGPSSPSTSESPGSTDEVVTDIGTVVDDVIRSTGFSRIALFGHASGGHWAAMYAAQHPDKVAALVLLNSMYGVDAPWGMREAFEGPKHPGSFDESAGPYRFATAEGLLAAWNRSIPNEDKAEWRDPQVAAAYVALGLASDPTSETRKPPSARIPGGWRKDHYLLSKGRKFWDAHDLKTPVLYMRGSLDHWSRPEDLEAIRRGISTTGNSRFVTIPNATHFLFLDRPEHGRTAMLKEIDGFLSKIE